MQCRNFNDGTFLKCVAAAISNCYATTNEAACHRQRASKANCETTNSAETDCEETAQIDWYNFIPVVVVESVKALIPLSENWPMIERDKINRIGNIAFGIVKRLDQLFIAYDNEEINKVNSNE